MHEANQRAADAVVRDESTLVDVIALLEASLPQVQAENLCRRRHGIVKQT